MLLPELSELIVRYMLYIENPGVDATIVTRYSKIIIILSRGRDIYGSVASINAMFIKYQKNKSTGLLLSLFMFSETKYAQPRKNTQTVVSNMCGAYNCKILFPGGAYININMVYGFTNPYYISEIYRPDWGFYNSDMSDTRLKKFLTIQGILRYAIYIMDMISSDVPITEI